MRIRLDDVGIITAMLRAVAAAVVLGMSAHPAAQSPAPAERLTFEVVSIKRNTAARVGDSSPLERPDGGITMTNVPVLVVLNRAFAPTSPAEMDGVPDWVRTERYDIRATSSLPSATPAQRAEMLQASED